MYIDRVKLPSLKKKLNSQGLQEKALFKRAGSSFVIRVLGAGLGLGVNVLLGRLLGVEDYGVYTFIFSWISIFIVFLPLGFDKSLLRFIPEYEQKKDWANLKGVWILAFKVVVGLGLLVALSIVGGVFIIDTDSWGYSKEPIILGAILLLLMGLNHVTFLSLMGLKKIAAALIPQAMVVQVVMAATMLAFFYFKGRLSVENAIIAKAVGVSSALLIGGGLLWKLIPRQIKEVKKRKHDKYWLKISFPMMLISGAFIILGKTDLIMIRPMLGEYATGVYGAVLKVGSLVLFGVQVITVALAPQISELFHSHQIKDLQKVIRLGNRISFAFAVCGVVFFVFLGKFVLSIFGAPFVRGYNVLLICVISYLFNAFSGISTYIMTMTGYQNMAFKILAGSGLLNIILNYFLIKQMGIEGAAISSAISMILWNTVMIIYIKRKLGLNATIF